MQPRIARADRRRVVVALPLVQRELDRLVVAVARRVHHDVLNRRHARDQRVRDAVEGEVLIVR